jgi:hypothetical protein
MPYLILFALALMLALLATCFFSSSSIGHEAGCGHGRRGASIETAPPGAAAPRKDGDAREQAGTAPARDRGDHRCQRLDLRR